MIYNDPKELRNKLTTDFAKAAFDELSSLGISWEGNLSDTGSVYLSPLAKIITPCKSSWSSLLDVWSKNIDDAVINNHAEIMGLTKRGNILVVFNSDNRQASRFEYSNEHQALTPVLYR